MANENIRIAILRSGKKQYEIASLLGMSETHLSRKLRSELPADEQERICKLIDEYAERREKHDE